MSEYTCPSPDPCPFTTDEITELTEHINSEHGGEFAREDWPDTPAGRAARSPAEPESDEPEDDPDA
ncbi:hypothetical protein [Natrarchaeobius oligotrophus]|uniref:Uncharacterized protein n=1 Tax=Natrarchaeobius chitinivorans TaxID=1679083 RepID=A0A3N6M0C6_NATCH|nr:hypothetical protein [Natrarchaeobius chitinivorans]RQG93714.1 hypothetical protein EA472_22525 [Natrarchaeobius chitinivorans]